MKIKFNSDDDLPPNKAIEIPSMIIVIRAIFLENNKYYPHYYLLLSDYLLLAKQKHLLPFNVTNNELKEILY